MSENGFAPDPKYSCAEIYTSLYTALEKVAKYEHALTIVKQYADDAIDAGKSAVVYSELFGHEIDVLRHISASALAVLPDENAEASS